ncbi:ABC transporter ATP-binding protein [Pontivivens ytuae]|uniref:ATP-binding cassette domain-containing protein n=1 Tax=Pontivivens ytuae TaxID=2789856 RepID=A0A7S9QF29_9RHOB|nr:ATP-binding cassette domain-containing protein [Pontivivens ytuae]QPH55821.1 ATP-binding cassette domain-containing protein [Pontivivens ytuae]
MGLPLEVRGLVLTGDEGERILHVPALDIATGTAVALRGPSGAGKSTFLHAVSGLREVAEGTVTWDGADVAALAPERRAAFRRDALGIVFQDHLLFEELDALGNASIATGFARRRDRAVIRERARTALGRLGIAQAEGRRVASFSGGERQRVAVARALAAGPRVLLADEPTANLDRETADRLIEDVVALVREQGLTLLVASHDPHLIARMDRVLEVRDGTIVEPGREAAVA